MDVLKHLFLKETKINLNKKRKTSIPTKRNSSPEDKHQPACLHVRTLQEKGPTTV